MQNAANALQENYTAAYAGAQDTHRSAQQMLDSLTKVLPQPCFQLPSA